MLAEVGEIPGGARSLIPVVQRLVEAEDEVSLRKILEQAVGLTNGKPHHHVPAAIQPYRISRPEMRSLGVS
jgi:hypothetical protein